MALPHVNLLSKVDLVEKFGKLQFGLDYYTEVVTNHNYNYTQNYNELLLRNGHQSPTGPANET